MSNLFNLTIGEYKREELEDLFALKYPYTKGQILVCGEKIRKKVSKDKNLKDKDRKKVDLFINSAIAELSQTLTDPILEPKLKKNEIVESSGHPLIKRPKIPDSGILNPYTISNEGDKNIMIKTINIDSTFRNNYFTTKASDFTLTLPTEVRNVVEMKLVACELPQSIYAISDALGNNFFTIIYDLSGGITEGGSHHEVNLVLRDGNYFPIPCGSCNADMQTELNFQLSRPEPHGTGGRIQASIDRRTGKVIIAGAGDDNFIVVDPSGNPPCIGAPPCPDTSGTVVGGMPVTALALLFNTRNTDPAEFSPAPIQLKLGWMLGYRFGKYEGNTAYTSEGIYDFRGLRYLYLVVDDYNKNHSENIVGIFNSSLTQPENILARLSWKQYAFFSTTNEPLDNVYNSRAYFGPVDIRKLHIRILDLFGRVISLNNMDFSMALEFKCLYKV